MFHDAQWIGIPTEEYREKQVYAGDANNRFAYFRLDFDALAEGAAVELELSAVSRYRLWINGQPVGSGPCRGDRWRHFVDRRKTEGCFRDGRNTVCVQVLLCDFNAIDSFGEERMPLISVADVPAGHRLALEGELVDREGRHTVFTTGTANWHVWLDQSFRLKCIRPVNDNMGAMCEEIDFSRSPAHWREPDFDASGWKKAHVMEGAVCSDFMKTVGFLPPLVCEERPIPLLFETKEEAFTPASADCFPLKMVPGQKAELTLRANAHMNAYIRYFFRGGKGAKISFTCFERYQDPEAAAGRAPDTNRVRRDDDVNGVIPSAAVTDRIILPGGSICYEPFWYRTFRFLKLTIETADEPLTVEEPETYHMGYPLHAEAVISSTAPWVKHLYEICLRTLQNCMTDAYMDCPYYEQMQYPMDTRLQALFTYTVSADTALARKALEDFHSSMTPYGFIQGRAPSGYTQIISTFSVFYIRMLFEYWEHTGDLSVLRRYRSDCDMILDAFQRSLDAETGLLGKTGFWDFVDWQDVWTKTGGQPAALEAGPSSVMSLMLAGALEDTAGISELLGDSARAQEYRSRKAELLQALRTCCYDLSRGMLREGPEYPEFSQGTQSWAVLTGLFSGQEAKTALRHSVEDGDVLKCTFSTSFEFFRACEKAGCYALTKDQLQLWINLLEEHCTTVPETPAHSRSECHGWSALPIFELFHVMAGIRQVPGKPDTYTVKPQPGNLRDITGSLPVSGGLLQFAIHTENGKTDVRLDVPAGVQVSVEDPD